MSFVNILEKCKVEKAPESVYYISNFITEEEETEILKRVYSSPKPKWTNLAHRRLQDYGGIPHKNGMIVEEIPCWLQTFVNKVNTLCVFGSKGTEANHVLVNEYLPNQGIMAHTDGPLFFPCVTTISCGSHTILEFSKNNDKQISNLLLERRSLVVIRDEMYTGYLHAISEKDCDIISDDCMNIDSTCHKIGDTLKRDTRISLTIRNVPKVCKLKLTQLINK